MSDRIIQLYILLGEVEPAVWRRIQVPADHCFAELHLDLQDAMGWGGYHGYSFFDAKGSMIRTNRPEPISLTLTEGMIFQYLYDYDSKWMHLVTVEKILDAQEGVFYPIALDGEQACPLEDMGGAEFYQDLADRIRAAKDIEDEERARELFDDDDWMYLAFDPDEFVLEYTHFTLAPISPEEKHLEDYIVSAVNLYGMISTEKLIEIYNSHHPAAPLDPIDPGTCMAGDLKINLNRLEDRYVEFDEGYFEHESLIYDEEQEALVSSQRTKPWYIPEQEEFLKHLDDKHIMECPAFDRLKEYLSLQPLPMNINADDIAEGIALGCNEVTNPQGGQDSLGRCNIGFTKAGMEIAVHLVDDLKNSMRLWVNNGYSQSELSGMTSGRE